MRNIVEISNLVKSYENGHIKALNGIDLTIREGVYRGMHVNPYKYIKT